MLLLCDERFLWVIPGILPHSVTLHLFNAPLCSAWYPQNNQTSCPRISEWKADLCPFYKLHFVAHAHHCRDCSRHNIWLHGQKNRHADRSTKTYACQDTVLIAHFYKYTDPFCFLAKFVAFVPYPKIHCKQIGRELRCQRSCTGTQSATHSLREESENTEVDCR